MKNILESAEDICATAPGTSVLDKDGDLAIVFEGGIVVFQAEYLLDLGPIPAVLAECYGPFKVISPAVSAKEAASND